jgi:hypothetical protein
MLKILQQSLKHGEIKYYWDKRCNLIEGFQTMHKENLVGRLDRIIARIENNVSHSPIVIAEHIRKFCGFKLYTHYRMEEPLTHKASEWQNKTFFFVYMKYKFLAAYDAYFLWSSGL